MKMIRTTLVMVLLSAVSAFGQSNPCDPMGGHKAAAVNPCFAKAGTVFHINDPAGRDWVTFKSSAPLEDIVGTTSAITGYLVFDPANPKKGGKGELTVAIASLDTGIPLRNEHLQSADWLNAGSYPDIKLTITDVKKVKKVKSSPEYQTYDVVLVGKFTLAGKTRSVEFPGRLTYLIETEKTRQKLPGDLLAARAAFDVRLADYGITGPKGAGIIGNKVGETVSVEVSIIGSSVSPGMAAANPCNPCGGEAMNACNPCGGPETGNPCNPCGM